MRFHLAIASVICLIGIDARLAQENPAVEKDINKLLDGSPVNFVLQRIPVVLKAKADPCDYLIYADQLVEKSKLPKAQLSDSEKQALMKLLQTFVTSEHNYKPVPKGAGQPSFCDNASLPVTKELRGLLPIVDPSSGGKGGLSAADYNSKVADFLAKSQSGDSSVSLNADGKSVRQMVEALGFVDCVGCKASNVPTPASSSASSSPSPSSSSSSLSSPIGNPNSNAPVAEAANTQSTQSGSGSVTDNTNNVAITMIGGTPQSGDAVSQLRDICRRFKFIP